MGTGMVEMFADLFDGSSDAHGTEQGGCVRTPPDYVAHLDGTTPVGVYPMKALNGDWYVKWGCIDLDVRTSAKPSGDYDTEHQAHVAAVNVVAALRHFQITGWIERTRSHGRHVWAFAGHGDTQAQQWCHADVMRRALLTACGLVDASKREINPKAESLSDGQLGNYVRLPYPGWMNEDIRDHSARTMVVPGDGSCISLENMVARASEARTPIARLRALAAHYKPQPALATVDLGGSHRAPDVLAKRLNGLGFTIWRDGALDGGDRSNTLLRLAYQCQASSLSAGEALAIVADADTRIGKYVGRPDAQRYYLEKVERAYGG